MALLKLYVDVQNRRLVASERNPAQVTLPKFIQGDVMPIALYLVQPDTSGGLSNPLSIITDSYSVKLGLTTPGASSSTVHASVTLSGPDSAGKYTGSLALNTTEITNLLGSGTSASATFEIELTSSGDIDTPVQLSATVYADGLKAASVSPVPPDVALTAATAAATYVKKTGAAGEGLTLKSADGTRTVIIYVGNDGVVHMDPVT